MRTRKKPESTVAAATLSALDARFRAPLMAYFMRRVRNAAEAEDLTQEVFARLIGSDSFMRAEEDQLANAFVFRVAGNLLLDRARASGRWRMQSLAGDKAMPETQGAGEFVEDRSPERLLIGRENLDEVHSCLSEVDERSKGIFMLFRLGGMKQKEIASLYGVSLSTVEKALLATSALLAERFPKTRRSIGS